VVQQAKPVARLAERPPVVTILGHVDHGKTTLLDHIRHAKVAEGEFGGITQRIGAYQVDLGDRGKITFIDTPGHAAFTQMRARGAQVTDIAVLIVAADDGIMPQTREAINHARAADVPIVVAINKTDLPGVNLERIYGQLAELDLAPEEWGGDTPCISISAKTGQGVDDLMENILTVAYMRELKADPQAKPSGTVLEAEMDKGLGPVATVLMKEGTLKVGDAVVIGSSWGRIRFMMDDKGQQVPSASPSTAVKIVGLSSVPDVGERLQTVADEKKSRSMGEERGVRDKEVKQGARHLDTLEDVIQRRKRGETKQLNVILKGDNQGSVEAIEAALPSQGNEDVPVHVLHAAVGPVTESDVLLASVSDAMIVGFNVRVEPASKRAALDQGITARTYRIIYELLDDVAMAAKGMLKPVYEELVMGHAQIRQIFRLPGNNRIAGCMVTDGRIARPDQVRVKRGTESLWEGKIDTLKRVKDDAREVAAGYECGIVLNGFNDIEENDVIESFVMQEVGRR
jgi:translation initiation factor IF-2